MENVVKIIKDIIDHEGPEFINRNPYDVYKNLIAGDIDPPVARLVLLTLLSGTAKKAKKMGAADLSKDIQSECFLKKAMADRLATMYEKLYDCKNISEWRKMNNSGFRELCNDTITFKWDESKEWHHGNGYVVCSCSVEADFRVTDQETLKNALKKPLKENPFITSKQIKSILQKKLEQDLDSDMDDYVFADDYYEPWMPDYDCEDVLEDFGKELGLELIQYSCDGDTSDWEVDGRW